MKTQRVSKRLLAGLIALGVAAGLAACGGSDDNVTIPTPAPVASQYLATTLVADAATTPVYGSAVAKVDARLVNPSGLAFNPAGLAWVANNASSSATLYDSAGVAQAGSVTLPAATNGAAKPTGVVYNATTSFSITSGAVTAPATVIFASESGAIYGWAATVDPVNAVIAADQGAAGGTGAIYKGLALSSFGGANYIYATDFRNKRVDVYDTAFARVSVLPGAFVNPTLPAGYAPYGIHAISGNIYVTYAKADATSTDPVFGAGLGQVDVFTAGGVFVKTLIPAGGALNAPWGMAMAPAVFGDFSGALLVGNAGDGKINAFNATSGAYVGTLSSAAGVPLSIDGLGSLAFGNGVGGQAATSLFFTAGPANKTHGLYGRLDLK